MVPLVRLGLAALAIPSTESPALLHSGGSVLAVGFRHSCGCLGISALGLIMPC